MAKATQTTKKITVTIKPKSSGSKSSNSGSGKRRCPTCGKTM